MSKKKKVRELPVITEEMIDRTIIFLIEKYSSYSVINDDLVKSIVLDVRVACENENTLKELSERKLLMILFKNFEEDIDSEILFIESARANINRVVRMTLFKYGIMANDEDYQYGETLFTKAYNSYHGAEDFFSYYIKYIREGIKRKRNIGAPNVLDNNTVKDTESKLDEGVRIDDSHPDLTIEVGKKEPVQVSTDSLQETVSNPVVRVARGRYKTLKGVLKEFRNLPKSIERPNAEAELFRELDLGSAIKTRDYDLLRYVALRYGYWNDTFYTDDEITNMLSLTEEQLLKYRRYTMYLLRDAIAQYIRAVGIYKDFNLKLTVKYKNAKD